MGFLDTATTITLTAKLTPFGRTAIATNTFPQIASFCLGDSDANYYAAKALTSGQVPTASGNIGSNNTVSNSVSPSSTIRSQLIYNGGSILKIVEQSSNVVSTEIASNGEVTISGVDLTQNVINRNDFATDSLVNLYYSFGLPLNSTDDTTYTSRTFTQGGFADTSLSGLATTKIVVLGINNSKYGETLDGRQVNILLPTDGGPTYNIYSTYQNTGTSPKILDNTIIETSITTKSIGSNIAFLFSDTIKTPNGDPSLSWSTGFGSVKPFSIGKKSLYTLQTDSNLGLSSDTIVGVAYLDKGFIVITDPTIVADFGPINLTGASTGTSITVNSVSTSVFQNITCIAGRGEFGGSTNRTFVVGDTPRITEVGLYDSIGNLIAIAKTDSQILKNINEFKAFGINISL